MQRCMTWLFGCALVALATLPSIARADHPRPYKGEFNFTITSMTFPSATEVQIQASVDGHETHLGHFTGEVTYNVDLVTGAFVGQITKVAANGDLLFDDLTGQFAPDFSSSKGTFVIVGGTGRFLEATGGGTFASTVLTTTLGHVTFDGTISY